MNGIEDNPENANQMSTIKIDISDLKIQTPF